jgi:2-oxoglutarate ferredoxin oxidoreductase subunit alpha
MTIRAFNLSEQYRVPVMVMMDECVGHMTEKVVIPPAEEIDIYPRRYTRKPPGDFLPFLPTEDGVPEMVRAGEGYKIHVTGLTHDEKGYPNLTPDAQDRLVKRLAAKILDHEPEIRWIEEEQTEDAQIVVVSYGITSRVAARAIEMAREKGIRVGSLRLLVAWPFPEPRIRELAERIQGFVVPELNLGQMSLEVERCSAGKARVVRVPHAGGTVHEPQVIFNAILEAAK